MNVGSGLDFKWILLWCFLSRLEQLCLLCCGCFPLMSNLNCWVWVGSVLQVASVCQRSSGWAQNKPASSRTASSRNTKSCMPSSREPSSCATSKVCVHFNARLPVKLSLKVVMNLSVPWDEKYWWECAVCCMKGVLQKTQTNCKFYILKNQTGQNCFSSNT